MALPGWRSGKISDFFILQRGFDLTRDHAVEGPVPVYSSSGVSYYHNEAKVKGPGVVTGRKGKVGQAYFIEEDFWPHDTTLWVKDFKGNHPKFVKYFLDHIRIERFDEASSVPTINRNNVHAAQCGFPCMLEQIHICNLLDVWELFIENTKRLLWLKESRKRALEQSHLLGKSRLRGHDNNWRVVQLKEVTEELKSRNNVRLESDAVMAVNKFQGLIPMREHVMASSLERYKVVPPKAFAYNPMRINIGSLAMSHHASDVLVSPDYVVFKCLDDRCDPDFLDHYRRTHAWEHYVDAAGNGSVRVRIYYSELARMKLRLPPIEEQRAISQVLNDAKREIELTKQKLAALQKQKRGLMQKLLTGKWRIKREWEEK